MVALRSMRSDFKCKGNSGLQRNTENSGVFWGAGVVVKVFCVFSSVLAIARRNPADAKWPPGFRKIGVFLRKRGIDVSGDGLSA